MPSKETLIATNRFGLGASKTDIAHAASDPKKWLRDQINADQPIPEIFASQADSVILLKESYKARAIKIEVMKKNARKDIRKGFYKSLTARLTHQVQTQQPFAERLVMFWSNHFTVSLTRNIIGPAIPAYENEAIRPHIFGRFEDTGWTVSLNRKKAKNRKAPLGTFFFDKRIHEPGPQKLLGKTYDQEGKRQGIQALKAIARHPSTANFIATKLVRHFVDDNPSAEDIQTIADVFTETNGDLAAVSNALIDLESAWKMSGTKVKTPEEMIISSLRALQLDKPAALPRRQLLFPALKSMGQQLFRAPSPAGWPDDAKAWIAPESLMHRIEWARAFSRHSAAAINPLDIFDNTIGPFASEEAKRLIKGAPSKEDGLALIFSSPAFQRR